MKKHRFAILDTIGVIGANSLHYAGQEKWAFTLATVFVSCVWFFALAVAGRLLGRLDETGVWITRLNKLSAAIIWALAGYMGWNLL